MESGGPWLSWVAGLGVALLTALSGIAWRTKPSRDEMNRAIDEAIKDFAEEDDRKDATERALIEEQLKQLKENQTSMRAHLDEMHRENRHSLEIIEGDVKLLLSRGAKAK